MPRYLETRWGGRSVWSPPWQQVVVVGWSGMRGVVSLAAALALPLTTSTDEPFPHRTLIIALTFRDMLIRLRDQGIIDDEIYWRLQREIDLEESRLPV